MLRGAGGERRLVRGLLQSGVVHSAIRARLFDSCGCWICVCDAVCCRVPGLVNSLPDLSNLGGYHVRMSSERGQFLRDRDPNRSNNDASSGARRFARRHGQQNG